MELLVQRQNLMMASVGIVMLQSWRHGVLVEDVLAGHTATMRFLSKLPAESRFATCAVGDIAVKLPDDAARKASIDSLQKLSPRSVATATVIEGTGFLASAARAAVTGILLLGKGNQRAFSNMEDASVWLVARPALETMAASVVCDAMLELRRAHKA